MKKGNKSEVSIFQLLGSLIGLPQAGGSNVKVPSKLKIETQQQVPATLNNQSGQGFKSLAEKINFGGGFR